MTQWPKHAAIYSETVVHSAPQQFASEAPYQIAIVEGADGQRFTVRILQSSSSERPQIGEAVGFAEERDGVAYYRPVSRS